MMNLPLGQTGLLGVLILFGILQGFFLVGVFWTRRAGDRLANGLLGTVILLITLHLTEIFLLLSGLIMRVPFPDGATFPLIFLISPLIFLYGRRLLVPGYRLRWVHLLHAIPAAYVLYTVWPWLMVPAEMKVPYHQAYQSRELPTPDAVTLAILGFNVLQHVVYLGLTVRLIRRRESELRDLSADNALAQGLEAFRRITLGFAVYAALYLVFFVALLGWGKYGVTVDTIWLVVLAFLIQAVGYVSIVRPATFAHVVGGIRDEVEEAGETEVAGGGNVAGKADGAGEVDSAGGGDVAGEADAAPGMSGKYRRSSLSASMARRIREKLVRLMDDERPYLQGDLRLRDVADRLGVSPHHLSQVINQEGGERFFDFVNRYRVEEAKRRLRDPRAAGDTVLAIGLESGFNNKASFNAAFRRFAGTTPSAFRAHGTGSPADPPAMADPPAGG